MEYATKNRELAPLIRARSCMYTPDGERTVTVKRPLAMFRFALGAAVGALLAFLLVMLAIRKYPLIAEGWTSTMQRGYEVVAGTLTSILPFSVLELFVCLLIIVGAYLFVRLVINLCFARFKRILTGLLVIAAGAAYVLDLYVLSMGFGYYRAKMPMVAAGEDYTAEDCMTAAEYFLADYNALAEKLPRDKNGCVISPYGISELGKKLKDEYARLDSAYFFSYTPDIKPIVNSWIMSDFLITGITFLPVGESAVNIAAPPTTVTYTAAHELAHAKGVQREGDANVLSYYILLSSDDEYLRYCGYYATFYGFLEAVQLAGDADGYQRILRAVSPLVNVEHVYAAEYWDSQPDIMGKLGEWFNNMYLESNGAENGTGSYTDGAQTDTVTPIDPDTGEPEIDPDTQEPVVIPVYSQIQKIYFYLYENRK